jgi:hypothetical protein
MDLPIQGKAWKTSSTGDQRDELISSALLLKISSQANGTSSNRPRSSPSYQQAAEHEETATCYKKKEVNGDLL